MKPLPPVMVKPLIAIFFLLPAVLITGLYQVVIKSTRKNQPPSKFHKWISAGIFSLAFMLPYGILAHRLFSQDYLASAAVAVTALVLLVPCVLTTWGYRKIRIRYSGAPSKNRIDWISFVIFLITYLITIRFIDGLPI